VNKAIILGKLTRDPETRSTQSGASVVSFGVAHNARYKSASGEPKEDVLFIDCTAFGKTGETIAQYMRKGSEILIEGRLKLDQWEDKEGQRRSKIGLIVDHFHFTGKGQQQEGQAQVKPATSPAKQAKTPQPTPISDEDIPF